MDVDVVLFELFAGDAQFVGVRLDPLQRDGGRLLHHVAQVAGHREGALARGEDRLDVEDVAAHFGPGEARDDAPGCRRCRW